VNRKFSTFVLLACSTSSLAFAGEKHKADSTKRAQASDARKDSDRSQKKARKKHTDKAPPTQEEQFEEVLRGIYG